jgi:hypothetical protein
METLLGPTSPVGTTIDGPMSDFDPTQKYVWPFLTYQGTYAGPTDSATLTADTLLDTSLFANSYHGTFTIQLDQPNKLMDLVYTPTPVPEPETLGLVGIGTLVVLRRANRHRRRWNAGASSANRGPTAHSAQAGPRQFIR